MRVPAEGVTWKCQSRAELLELTGIEPVTTVAAMAEELPLLDADSLARAFVSADAVLSI